MTLPWTLLTYLAGAHILACNTLAEVNLRISLLTHRWLKKSGGGGKDVVASVNSGSKVVE